MSSQYFDFSDGDEEMIELLDNNAFKETPIANKTPVKIASPDRIPISKVHALLGKDSSTDESTLNSTLNESSFYGEEDTSINQSHLNSTFEESFSVDDSTANIVAVVNGKLRKIARGGRKRKALSDLDNKTDNFNTPARKIKKPNSRKSSAVKDKENQKPKRAKTTKKNVADENYEQLAEEINKRFEEIEKYKLVIE